MNHTIESEDSSMDESDTTYVSQAIENSTQFYKTIQKQFEHQNKVIHELQKKVKKHEKIVLTIQPQQQQQPIGDYDAMKRAAITYKTMHESWFQKNKHVEIMFNGSWIVATLDSPIDETYLKWNVRSTDDDGSVIVDWYCIAKLGTNINITHDVEQQKKIEKIEQEKEELQKTNTVLEEKFNECKQSNMKLISKLDHEKSTTEQASSELKKLEDEFNQTVTALRLAREEVKSSKLELKSVKEAKDNLEEAKKAIQNEYTRLVDTYAKSKTAVPIQQVEKTVQKPIISNKASIVSPAKAKNSTTGNGTITGKKKVDSLSNLSDDDESSSSGDDESMDQKKQTPVAPKKNDETQGILTKPQGGKKTTTTAAPIVSSSSDSDSSVDIKPISKKPIVAPVKKTVPVPTMSDSDSSGSESESNTNLNTNLNTNKRKSIASASTSASTSANTKTPVKNTITSTPESTTKKSKVMTSRDVSPDQLNVNRKEPINHAVYICTYCNEQFPMDKLAKQIKLKATVGKFAANTFIKACTKCYDENQHTCYSLMIPTGDGEETCSRCDDLAFAV